MDSASEGRYDGPTLLDGLRACAGIPCRRSSVRDVHVHATAPVVNGDRDLGRIIRLDHRHLEHLHVTPFRIHAVRLTSIACRFCEPSPARSLCERIRFGGLRGIVRHGVPHNVVLLILCASLRSRSCSHASSPCRTSPRVLRQPGPRSLPHCPRQLRTPVCSGQVRPCRAPRRPGPRARRSPPCCRRRRACRSLPLSLPPMSPALQSPSRPGCDGWLIDETTNPGIRYTRDEALPRRS